MSRKFKEKCEHCGSKNISTEDIRWDETPGDYVEQSYVCNECHSNDVFTYSISLKFVPRSKFILV
jgi:transposase-like protein